MTTKVADEASNRNETIENAAKAIGSSEYRRRVFEVIHHGKSEVKTVSAIAKSTGFTNKQVLDAAKPMVKKHLFEQIERSVHGDTAYKKNQFLQEHKKEILRLAGNKKAIESYPTKRNPKSPTHTKCITLKRIIYYARTAKVARINLEDLSDFKLAHNYTASENRLPEELSEDQFRNGIQKIISEPGEFKDWGGEQNDLFTSRLIVDKKRRAAAFAFKGPGLKSKLIPKNMGKNGDQAQRLFNSPAEVFIIQHWREIDEGVYDLAERLAVARSIATGKKVWYCILDGKDSRRIYDTYSSYFE